MELPDEYRRRVVAGSGIMTFGEVFTWMLCKGRCAGEDRRFIVLGLQRSSSSAATMGNDTPYVYTCPRIDSQVNADDQLYVLELTDPVAADAQPNQDNGAGGASRAAAAAAAATAAVTAVAAAAAATAARGAGGAGAGAGADGVGGAAATAKAADELDEDGASGVETAVSRTRSLPAPAGPVAFELIVEEEPSPAGMQP